MARRRYFQMRNWDRFQHYKKRNPPWIKIYTDLLANYDYAQLSDESKSHLHGLWLLAAKTGNRLPWDRKWLKKVIGSENEPNLSELQAHDFIEPWCLQDASKVLVLAETETETEERKGSQEPQAAPAATPRPVDNSVKNPSGPSLWDVAREHLGGPCLGKLLKTYPEPEVEAAIMATLKKRPAEWKSYLMGVLKNGNQANGPDSRRRLSAPERVERAIAERNRARAGRGRVFDGEVE